MKGVKLVVSVVDQFVELEALRSKHYQAESKDQLFTITVSNKTYGVNIDFILLNTEYQPEHKVDDIAKAIEELIKMSNQEKANNYLTDHQKIVIKNARTSKIKFFI
jgi:hypothetical protein